MDRTYFWKRTLLAGIATFSLVLALPPKSEARKTTLRMNAHRGPGGKRSSAVAEEEKNGVREVSRDSDSLMFMAVASRLRLSGYEKPLRSARETLFITNMTELTLRGISLEITYLSPDGRMLHRREVNLKGTVPPGETRREDFKSWDLQRSFYYAGGEAPMGKNAGRTAPFDVALRILSVSL